MTVAYRKGGHGFVLAPGVMLDEDFDEPEMFVAWLREQAFEGHLGDALAPEASTWQYISSLETSGRPRRERPTRPHREDPVPQLPPRDHLAAAAELRALGMEAEAQIAERLERDRIACQQYRQGTY